ncbi:S41 family peptidase [Fontivita pretiosa]|uniref:S41 family peptidase n=1 Tax=Fontivita pretiosa TaxID=2989684 RepID=UPI003D18396B
MRLRFCYLTISVFSFLASLASVCAAGRAGVPAYCRWPTIHGDRIVFTAEGDLWKITTFGGLAVRLTSHPANEMFARFSPDGTRIALTADYDGNSDIYVMSSEGGEPRRLTYDPAREECAGWTPDGKHVLFRARRSGLDTDSTLYQVSADGGQPEVVRVGKCEAAAFSGDGKLVAFNQFLWNGTWKRYRGGTAPRIWIGDMQSGRFWAMTDGQAVEQHPMWIGDRVYYLSERTYPMNIWSSRPDGSDARQVTRHVDYDVRNADTDGKSIAYTTAADLWVMDVATGESRKIELMLPSDRIRERRHVQDASKTTESFAISDDGRRVVVSSRGEIWNAPARPGGRIIQVTPEDSAIRQRAPAFSPDAKQIVCITDESGEQELAVYDAAGREKHRILTRGEKGWIFQPIWSADSKHIAYADLTGTLYIVDAETTETKQVDQDKNWELTEYTFSPDGKWLAYTKYDDNRVRSVYLYELATGTIQRISAGFTNDYSPAWDPQGKYLYFLSNRVFRPYMDDLDMSFLVTRSAKPCIVILAREGRSPLLAEELLEDPKHKDTNDGSTTSTSATRESDEARGTEDQEERKKDEGTKDEKTPKKLPEVKIDLDGIRQRVVELPGKGENCSALSAGEGKIYWIVSPTRGMGDHDQHSEGDGFRADGKLQVYDFKKRKEETFIEGLRSYVLSRDGKRIAWQKDRKQILVADTSSKPGNEIEEKVALDQLPLQVNPSDEWRQIFAEAWRLQRDFYWAQNMVGVDWPAMKKKYEPLLERVGSRGELNDLIGQLIGELGTSHTYVFGGDSTFQPPKPVAVGALGADIEIDKETGLHRFVRVLRPEPWETDIEAPLTMSHANVRDGDYLLAINGRELGPGDNVSARLVNLAGVEVLLTVCSRADRSDARDIQIKTLRGERELRYADWCRRNRQYVEDRSSGRIGYLHLPDMSAQGLIKFIEGFYPQTEKDALIIDDRSNHGGFVSQMLIEKLNRRIWAYMMPRRGMNATYPERAHAGYKCVLINEHAGSDGDIFPDSFRTMGLGPLIGKRTWGGVIGIRMDKRFVDAGASSQPEFAWWDAKRGWSIENVGVSPDIEVDYRPEDYVAGRDPQLDRAIQEMMRMMKEKPVERPKPPPFPVRAPAGPAMQQREPQVQQPAARGG